jgi:transposase-like protein
MENVQMSFSPEVKAAIVEELESGRMSLREAAVRGHTTVSRVKLWIDEYGKYKPKRDVVEVVMKSEEDRIAELEKALADSHLKNMVYEEMIALASKKFKVDLKKTFGSKVSGAPGDERGRELKRSARR